VQLTPERLRLLPTTISWIRVGHSDLLTPSDSLTGGAAGMDLALVTGTGPELLTNIDEQKPYVRPEDTVLFGYRSSEAEANTASKPMKSFPLDAIRVQGVAESAEQAITYLESSPALGFWLHLDVDVLSPEWMFAVDSPDPGGLTPEELAILLKTVSQSKRCAGMQITIYDPTLDRDGVCANRIVEILVSAFA
jgi:arginase